MRPESFGELADSSSLVGDIPALQQRMETDGYLFMRGLLPADLILEARASLTRSLSERGYLEDGSNPMDGLLKPGADIAFLPEIARHDPAVHRVVFGPEIHNFYKAFLETQQVRHFDYIWVRAMGHGKGTFPHCDIVYMGRGTHRVHTAWIPYGEVSLELGGLMILEGSHLQADRIRTYLNSDVDTYCENNPSRDGWKTGGALSKNPVTLREKLGGRWLTTEYRPGDVLTFRMDTVHASTDNQTQHVRLSTDTRYQRADEPVDERWIGPDPIGHSKAGKRGRIC